MGWSRLNQRRWAAGSQGSMTSLRCRAMGERGDAPELCQELWLGVSAPIVSRSPVVLLWAATVGQAIQCGLGCSCGRDGRAPYLRTLRCVAPRSSGRARQVAGAKVPGVVFGLARALSPGCARDGSCLREGACGQGLIAKTGAQWAHVKVAGAIVGDMCVGKGALLGCMRSHIERGQASKHIQPGGVRSEHHAYGAGGRNPCFAIAHQGSRAIVSGCAVRQCRVAGHTNGTLHPPRRSGWCLCGLPAGRSRKIARNPCERIDTICASGCVGASCASCACGRPCASDPCECLGASCGGSAA